MHASLLGFFLLPHMLNRMALLHLLYYGCMIVEESLFFSICLSMLMSATSIACVPTSCSKDFGYNKLASCVYKVTISLVVQRLSCVCVEVLYFLHKSLVPQYLS
jgi:hypothetical protein